METLELWYVQEIYRDEDNRDATRVAEHGVFYRSSVGAQAAADALNAKIQSTYQARKAARDERMRPELERQQAEHDALVAAGLRSGEFKFKVDYHQFSPVYAPEFSYEACQTTLEIHP